MGRVDVPGLEGVVGRRSVVQEPATQRDDVLLVCVAIWEVEDTAKHTFGSHSLTCGLVAAVTVAAERTYCGEVRGIGG